MAGKHYGSDVVFNDAAPSWCGFQPRLNRAFGLGWSGAANPGFTSGTPEFAAWTNGAAVAGLNPPTGQVAGRKWETGG